MSGHCGGVEGRGFGHVPIPNQLGVSAETATTPATDSAPADSAPAQGAALLTRPGGGAAETLSNPVEGRWPGNEPPGVSRSQEASGRPHPNADGTPGKKDKRKDKDDKPADKPVDKPADKPVDGGDTSDRGDKVSGAPLASRD